MKIDGYPQKKNKLIGRLKELTGKPAKYNGAPDFSFDIGHYRVFRDGSVAVMEEDLDIDILNTLVEEGLLIEPEIEEDEAETDPQEAPLVAPCEAREVPAPTVTNHRVEAPATPSIPASPTVYSSPIVIKDIVVTVQTMINLINMIHSKQDALNRMVGKRQAFWVAERVIGEIPYERPKTYASLMSILKQQNRSGYVKGVWFEQDSVIFTGFPKTTDYVVRKAYEKLAEAMYTHARDSSRIVSKRFEPENERYFCRNWLNKIGLNGTENRTIRKVLLKNLKGDSAYRTRAQAEAKNRIARIHSFRNDVESPIELDNPDTPDTEEGTILAADF